MQLKAGVYMMCLSVNDERSITPPSGFTLAVMTETDDGDATVYVYVREEAMVANF